MNYPAFEEALVKGDTSQLRLLYEVAIHQRNLAEDRVRCLLNTVSIGARAETIVTPVAPTPKQKTVPTPSSTEIEF